MCLSCIGVLFQSLVARFCLRRVACVSIRRFSPSSMLPQATISSRLRKHPRQISSSSRQQLRMHGEGTEEAGGLTDRSDRSGIDIDALAGRIRRLVSAEWAAPALQCPAVVAATGVKDYRDLPPAPVTSLAAFAPIPVFYALARRFRMFAATRRVGGRVWRYRFHCTRNGRPAVVGLEALHAAVFGNEC